MNQQISTVTINILVVALIVSCATRSNKNTWDGIWRIDQIVRGDVTISTYFVLNQVGQDLHGQVIINNAVELPIENVEVRDTMASFTIRWGARFELYPEHERMRILTSWNGGRPFESFAVRAGKEEIIPPPTIPLPALEEVPSNGLAPTPPMGWNSWNFFGPNISDQTVREIADAMVSSGMAEAGYEYIVIDDGWEGGRDSLGQLYPNAKFPDMKSLADYVHEKGLKLGIYSSPGPRTCGGYEGSYGHELQDARTFATWGIDYLKYDWCGAMRIYGYAKDSMQAAYQKMGFALLQCGRPIVYSICQYGYEHVWEWGAAAGGNLWRTTDDISDSWNRITEIGFSQNDLAPFAGPGHWNDPDMLEVGNGDLTFHENKSHFTLWCMLAAPLIAGNDLRNMSEQTLSILTNKDVIAVNQDPLGMQGTRFAIRDSIEIWVKPLNDNSNAIALFNRSNREVEIEAGWKELGWEEQPGAVYDLWSGKKMTFPDHEISLKIPSHGVVLLKNNHGIIKK